MQRRVRHVHMLRHVRGVCTLWMVGQLPANPCPIAFAAAVPRYFPAQAGRVLPACGTDHTGAQNVDVRVAFVRGPYAGWYRSSLAG